MRVIGGGRRWTIASLAMLTELWQLAQTASAMPDSSNGGPRLLHLATVRAEAQSSQSSTILGGSKGGNC